MSVKFKKNFDFGSRGGRGRGHRRIRKNLRGPSNKSLHRSIQRLQRGIELKNHDVLLSTTVDNAASNTIGALNIIPQGTGETDRTGSEVNITSVQFRARYTKNATAAVIVPIIRHLILWDSQCNGALPALGDVLDLTVVTDPTLAPYNMTNQKRFKILYDNSFSMAVGTAVTAELNNLFYKHGKRKASRQTKYVASPLTAGAITDIITNSLILIQVSTASANAPSVECGYRIIFKDV